MSVPQLIRSRHDLDSLLSSSPGENLCAIDTEADSLHRYRESLCLVQFARGPEAVLIDPIEIDDLSPLGDYLSTASVWMHGADYDMTMLKREFGTLPPVVFDTQIGARLLGERRFGLADLVERYFEVTLSKSSQKADWGKRPLSPKMIEYALNDVRYLLPMGEKIVAGLHEKGRYEWFVESCEAARRRVLERDESREEPWRIQGSGRLDRKGLHHLKYLWEWRDAEASSWDRPSFMVAPNRQLIEWSALLAGGRKIEFPPHYRADRRRRLSETLEAAKTAPSDEWPERSKVLRRRRDSEFDARVSRLLAARDAAGTRLEIDPSLLAPRAVLEAIAADECVPEDVLLGWQRQCLGLD